jgi:zinc transporter ZupT
METLVKILKFFSDPSRHFISAFFAGCLVFLVLAIVWSALSKRMDSSGRWTPSKRRAVTFGISLTLLLLAFAVGLGSHYLLDSFSTWYTTPLGPALTIIR